VLKEKLNKEWRVLTEEQILTRATTEGILAEEDAKALVHEVTPEATKHQTETSNPADNSALQGVLDMSV
jgi:hypothetical protein